MIEVVNPGIFTTVQDTGRVGYRGVGVPLSGFMDKQAAARANSLSGNTSGTALIEFASPGPTLRFKRAALLSVVGRGIRPRRNHRYAPTDKVFALQADDLLELGSFNGCFWGYLAIRGGIDSPVVLSSRSFYSGITAQPRLFKGDELVIGSETSAGSKKVETSALWTDKGVAVQIEAYQGPEFSLLGDAAKAALSGRFEISSSSNRMAYLLDHRYEISANAITTSAVTPGTVQLTPSGRLMVLMRDAQTTGGYARVLQLPQASINQLARLPVGSRFRFVVRRLHLDW